jgi:hypothetical protein
MSGTLALDSVRVIRMFCALVVGCAMAGLPFLIFQVDSLCGHFNFVFIKLQRLGEQNRGSSRLF